MDQLRLKYKIPKAESLEKVLRSAAAAGNNEDVTALLMEGIDLDSQAGDPAAQTPLHAAVKNGHLLTAQLLVSAGANTALEDATHRTALAYASSEAMRTVLERTSVELCV